jgi:tRNA (mo5U34)-methyltransferase
LPGKTNNFTERVGASFMARRRFSRWHTHFKAVLAERLLPHRHGELDAWLAALASLPKSPPAPFSIVDGAVTIGNPGLLDPAGLLSLESGLQALRPWRKGPYNFFGLSLDAEWRSDMKWERVTPHIGSLDGQSVLDVGCGNGYFSWRMLSEGAGYVLGIDPSVRFLAQFMAAQGYLQYADTDLLPLRSEDMPKDMACFDKVLSMGVIYHRKNPQIHLSELCSFLRPGGKMILETLVVRDAEDGVLIPQGRYAQMRNVWSIPTVDHMSTLMRDAGLLDVNCVDVTATTTREQRLTEWMQFQSLADFLDPQDPTRTIEGYPAPVRAIFIARGAGS